DGAGACDLHVLDVSARLPRFLLQPLLERALNCIDITSRDAELVQADIGVDPLAVGGTLALKIGEDFAEMPGKGNRTRGRAEFSAFLHVNVDHHERFRLVGSASTLK